MSKLHLEAPAKWVNGQPITVWVVGCGGNGGEAVDALSQFHLAHKALGGAGLEVAIFDDAVVREVNLVRQRFWHEDIGQYKAITLAHRYNQLLGLKWQGIPFRLEDAVAQYKPKKAPDLIISAVDLASSRRYIAKAFIEQMDIRSFSSVLWLDLGNQARSGQAILGYLVPNDEYPNVVAHYPELADMEDDTTKSCSTAEAIRNQDCLINRMITTAGMGLVWELLRHGYTDKNGIVVDMASGMQMPLAFPDVKAAAA